MSSCSVLICTAYDQVTCVGQVIGAVVAETQAQAQRAAKMVKISYEELPRILTMEVITLLISQVFPTSFKFNFGLVCRPLMSSPAHDSSEIRSFFPPLKGLALIGHFEVSRESGLMLCRIAPVSKIQSKLRRKNYPSPPKKRVK